MMDQKIVFERLERLFQTFFKDRSIRLTRDTTEADIEDWDSLEHVALLAAIEKEFRMKFTLREISGMKNVGEMADIIAERAKR